MTSDTEEITLSSDIFFKLSGAMDGNLTVMEKRFGVRITATDRGVGIIT